MITESHFLDYTNRLIEGDKENCLRIVEELIAQKTDIKEIYVELFQKALYRIGKMWEQNKVSISDEHLGTQITESLLYKFCPDTSAIPKNGKRVLVTCIDKEFHKLGAKMVADVFELNGWKTDFLGASAPTREIIKAIRDKNPHLIGLSFNFYLNFLRLLETIANIKKQFPEKRIIIGGQAVAANKEEILSHHPDIIFFEDIYQLDNYLKNNL